MDSEKNFYVVQSLFCQFQVIRRTLSFQTYFIAMNTRQQSKKEIERVPNARSQRHVDLNHLFLETEKEWGIDWADEANALEHPITLIPAEQCRPRETEKDEDASLKEFLDTFAVSDLGMIVL